VCKKQSLIRHEKYPPKSLEALPLLASSPSNRQREQEEDKKAIDEAIENINPTITTVASSKTDAKLVLQAGEIIGYVLLGTTGFFWLFWFNSPFFEYIEIPVIAGIILIAASFIYDNKSKKSRLKRASKMLP
jgi:hypothetical protein